VKKETIRAIGMLLRIKDVALGENTETGDSLVNACCCGRGVIADNIDAIISEMLRLETELASKKRQLQLSVEELEQWGELGFEDAPIDMEQDLRCQLRILADRFYGSGAEGGK